MSKIGFDFDEYPTIKAALNSSAVIAAIIGPQGSAKTTGVASVLLIEAIKQHPHDGVRRTKTVISRQTYKQMVKSTVPSWRTAVGGLVKFSDGQTPSGRAVFPLQDGTRVEWDIEFLALDSDTVVGDIQGYEATNALFDEASEMPDDELVMMLVNRLGRYPSAMQGGCRRHRAMVITNGPTKGHWLHQWAMGEKDKEFAQIEKHTGRRFFELFRQPPALLRQPDGDWKPNPLAENVQNLPGKYGYYFEKLALSNPKIQAYVEGEFADLRAGKPVYPQFSIATHVMNHKKFMTAWGGRGVIGLTFDFGRTPVCLAYVRTASNRLIIFDEMYDENVAIESFYKETVVATLKTRYPQARLGSDLVTGDPAGADKTQAVDVSPYDVLHRNGCMIQQPMNKRYDSLRTRLEATAQRFQRLDMEGIPSIQITDNCPRLIEALQSGYIYEKVRGKGDVVQETPTKTHDGWASDLANAMEYLVVFWHGVDSQGPRDRVKKVARVLVAG